jgi:hypothetical protein
MSDRDFRIYSVFAFLCYGLVIAILQHWVAVDEYRRKGGSYLDHLSRANTYAGLRSGRRGKLLFFWALLWPLFFVATCISTGFHRR